MPRDTPPPVPHRRGHNAPAEDAPPEPKKPQLVYEAAPEVRDLKKEATRFMPTAVANKIKLAKGEGRLLEPEEFDKLEEEGYMRAEKEGKAAETEAEADLELDAFLSAQGVKDVAEKAVEAAVQEAEHGMMAAEAKGEMSGSAAEGKVAERKLHNVEIEEAEDDGYD
ncbi:hypothetical protein CC80DRAFT_487326 [Byssothecium circinans]|uniref:Uncharacterized protein n=1 Tax=Byssothecium circinans TaxID=147558 RepID=A0A6A5UD94_9PLEO|nr:hypothetical protein CC80DRAFT_487326 [Byssothecium circinans]